MEPITVISQLINTAAIIGIIFVIIKSVQSFKKTKESLKNIEAKLNEIDKKLNEKLK